MLSVRSAGRVAEMKIAPNTEGLAGWLLARIKAWGGKESSQRKMHILETLSLGGRRQMMLVVCDGERYLVGGGPDSVETIVRVAGPDVVMTKQAELCV